VIFFYHINAIIYDGMGMYCKNKAMIG